MNTGKTLFAQLMDFLPWTTFTRIVDRYGGDHRVRTLSCAEQYRSMAFAQLTYRESLRDGSHGLPPAARRRDWRIHVRGVGPGTRHVIRMPGEDAVRRDQTVYALDSTDQAVVAVRWTVPVGLYVKPPGD